MSEGTSAPSGAPAASASEGTSTQNESVQGSKGVGAQAQGSHKEGGQATAASPKEAAQDDDSEEVKIGSVSGKVPKALAKTIKDLERGFHAKAQEVAQVKSYFQNMAKAAKDNPLAADELFSQLGIDAHQYSQAKLAKMLEQEMMSPEARQAMEYKQQLEKYQEQEKLTKAEQAKQQQQAQEMQLRQQTLNELIPILEKSGIDFGDDDFGPRYHMGRVIALKLASEEQGHNWTWQQCVDRISESRQKEYGNWVSKMDPETFEKMSGQKVHEWREYNLKRVTGSASQPSGTPKQSPGQKPVSGEKPSKSLSEKEWREYFSK